MLSPVRGLRPWRAGRLWVEKVPKPAMATVSSLASASPMTESATVTTLLAVSRDTAARSATRLQSLDLLTRRFPLSFDGTASPTRVGAVCRDGTSPDDRLQARSHRQTVSRVGSRSAPSSSGASAGAGAHDLAHVGEGALVELRKQARERRAGVVRGDVGGSVVVDPGAAHEVVEGGRAVEQRVAARGD